MIDGHLSAAVLNFATLIWPTTQQRVTVEHVHVHEGGQAIVGAVAGSAAGRGRGRTAKAMTRGVDGSRMATRRATWQPFRDVAQGIGGELPASVQRCPMADADFMEAEQRAEDGGRHREH